LPAALLRTARCAVLHPSDVSAVEAGSAEDQVNAGSAEERGAACGAEALALAAEKKIGVRNERRRGCSYA
jgi:hypothetical protein